MIVVDITSFFSATCGGIKTYYQEKARWLPSHGIECHFVVPGRQRSSMGFGGGMLHTIPGPPLGRHYRLFGNLRQLTNLLHELMPDIIEIGSHYILPDLVAAAVRSMRVRPRLVGFYHADFPSTYVAPLASAVPLVGNAALTASWMLVKRQHRRYAMTLVGSQHAAERLANAQVPRVHWVGLGVDTERFRPQPRRSVSVPVIAYCGRLSPEKHISLLVRGFDRIHAATGARLVLAGDGPLMPQVRRFAATRPQVTVHGYISDSERLAALMAAADLVVAPGPYESFSLTAAEAMACGTPVLGADRGGNAELIRGSGGGVTFAAGDVDSLVAHAVELLAAPADLRTRMGQYGRRHVEQTLTWRHVCQRIHAAYQQVL